MAGPPRRELQFALLQFAGSAEAFHNIGALLLDGDADVLYIYVCEDHYDLDEDATEILSNLADDLRKKAMEMGASALFAYLLDTLSNTIRICDPQLIMAADPEAALSDLVTEYLGRHG